jgi:hypothetical protein
VRASLTVKKGETGQRVFAGAGERRRQLQQRALRMPGLRGPLHQADFERPRR